MSSVMTHKGYEANVEYSEDDACFIGRIAGMRAIVGFQGNSVASLKKAFHFAVDNDTPWLCSVAKYLRSHFLAA